MRFDDTNPEKEKKHFEKVNLLSCHCYHGDNIVFFQIILEDLEMLQVCH